MTLSHGSHGFGCSGTCRPLSRRHAIAGVAAAGLGASILTACGGDDAGGEAGGEAGGSASGGSSGESGGASGGVPDGPLAAASEVPEGGGVIIEQAGVVVTQPTAGEFKAFSTTCTHQGCAVNEVAETIMCPCHGSQFSITDGSAVQGPATRPLATIPITVEDDQVLPG